MCVGWDAGVQEGIRERCMDMIQMGETWMFQKVAVFKCNI